MKRNVRVALVAILAVWLLATVVPSLVQLWAPFGSYGYTTDNDDVVDGVGPHGAAEAAGLRRGDRIDVVRLPAADRRPFGVTRAPYAKRPGVPLALPITRAGVPLTLHLVSRADRFDELEAALLVGRTLSAFVFVAVGAGLVLLRPSIMTWAFYLYCIGTEPGSIIGSIILLPQPFATIQALATTAAGDLALLGAFSFAIRFPNEGTSLIRRKAEAVAIVFIGALAIAEAVGQYLSTHDGVPTNRLFEITNAVTIATTAAIYATFFVTYIRGEDGERERIRYVIAAFTAALGGTLAETLLTSVGHVPYWITSVLDFAGVVVPIAVAYAVIRHRVMDVSFVVSRTIVYGLLTSFVIVVYSLIDWLCSTIVSATRVEAVAQVAASVAIGFSLSKLQQFTDRFVDRVFFRQRYHAEAAIRRMTQRLPHADSIEDVVHVLVEEAADALSLSSAAVFLRSEATADLFERAGACGWEGTTVERLFSDEQIVGKLARTKRLTSIGDLDLGGCALPEGIARPVVGLPITAHDELTAVVLYGQHKSGATLDPEEEVLLDRLADAAAAAYDHLEAKRLREELNALRRTVTSLERRINTGGAEPAPA